MSRRGVSCFPLRLLIAFMLQLLILSYLPRSCSSTKVQSEVDQQQPQQESVFSFVDDDDSLSNGNEKYKSSKDEEEKVEVLILICTQSFTAEQLVEDVLLDHLYDHGFSNVQAKLVDETGIDWSKEASSQSQILDEERIKLVSQARAVLVVASTCGDGDPPNHATEFANWLGLAEQAEPDADFSADPVPFAVFGLGDSTYLHFNAFAKYVDAQLAARGGQRLLPLYKGDASQDLSGDFETWCNAIVGALEGVLPPRHESDQQQQNAKQQQEQRPLFLSTGTDWRRSAIQPGSVAATVTNMHNLLLTDDSGDQSSSESSSSSRLPILHVELALPPMFGEQQELMPQPGDHLGIYPRNDHHMVERALNWLGLKADMKTKMMERRHLQSKNSAEWIEQVVSAYEFLAAHVDLTGRANPSTLRALLPFVGTLELRALARELTFINTTATTETTNSRPDSHPASAFDHWVSGRWLTNLDLAILFECRPSLQALARAIGPMQPRLYSIATVMNHEHRQDQRQANEDQRNVTTKYFTLGLCISVVEQGLCTNYVRKLPIGSDVVVFLRKSRFHFVPDGSPALLVGAGSGVGPYVGFLEQELERLEQASATTTTITSAPLAHTHIFFGTRSPSEILYRDRLSRFETLGSHMHYAFSRVFGQPKTHAQDLLRRSKEAVWEDIFENGGRLFVCGRLEIYSGVKDALIDVVRSVGGFPNEEALHIVEKLERDGRLLSDCWSVDPPRRAEDADAGETPRTVIQRLERHHSVAAENTCTQNQQPENDLSKIPAWPSYLRLVASGEFERRLENATNMFSACVACGRFCEVNRLSDSPEDWGECRVGSKAIVSAADAHFGEEACLKGTHGSGTIFFGACNLKCIYCQNWELSVMDRGEVVDDEGLASLMLGLQERGCHNINFVSPTHNVLAILRGIYIAAKRGLRLPIVWNTGGYDTVASLRLLEGIIDIYMPDAKYASRAVARKLSKIDNYPEINQAAIKEMFRQVGDLQIDPRTGLAWRGVLVRHLVLPAEYAGTYDIATFLANEVSSDTFTHVMDYYRPEHEARYDQKFGLNRKPTFLELRKAHQEARYASLRRIYEPLILYADEE